MSNTTSEYPDDVVIKQEQDVVLQEEDQLTLRALVSTKEAGVIIGKGGKNVAELRESTGVKAGVSKVVQGVHDRVLTVSGTLEGVAKVIKIIMMMIMMMMTRELRKFNICIGLFFNCTYHVGKPYIFYHRHSYYNNITNTSQYNQSCCNLAFIDLT